MTLVAIVALHAHVFRMAVFAGDVSSMKRIMRIPLAKILSEFGDRFITAAMASEAFRIEIRDRIKRFRYLALLG